MSIDLFPNGITPYAIGGVFIGVGVIAIYWSTGLIVGASTFLESTLSYFSKLTHLRPFVDSRDWRLVFTLGLVAGATLYALLFQGEPWVTEVQWWRLLLGGVLIGVGTRLGKGCTSGHGVCGLASLSSASAVNVMTFMLFAIGTAQLVQALGMVP
jgi:uncharacterized membrane protein YedE/YeeE